MKKSAAKEVACLEESLVGVEGRKGRESWGAKGRRGKSQTSCDEWAGAESRGRHGPEPVRKHNQKIPSSHHIDDRNINTLSA